MKFENVTKVQAAVLPLFLSNKDVCVKACTGSGKTLAFVVPLIERLLRIVNDYKFENKCDALPPNQVISVIIAPSRELVVQIFNVLAEFKQLFKNEENEEEKTNESKLEANFCYLIGGDKLDFDLQRINQKGANVIVSTPGRLFDILERNVLDLKKMEVLILDEADKILA